MNCAGDRLKILSVECEWIDVAVPTNDVEWMMRHRHGRPARSVFHQNLGVFFLVDRIELARSMKIAL